jgi:hypothetical protein
MDENLTPAPELDHISTMRRHLLEQLRALRCAERGEELGLEIRRAKAVTEVAQTLINAAKVEVEYTMAVKGASESTFLQEHDQDSLPHLPSQQQSPLPTTDTARLGGPPPDHPWRTSTVHRLKG